MFNTEQHGQYTISFDQAWLIDKCFADSLRQGQKARIEAEQAYIEFFNDFLSIERFAEYYGLSVDNAQAWVKLGRKINHAR